MTNAPLYLLPLCIPALFALMSMRLVSNPGRWPLALAFAPFAVALAVLVLLLTVGSGQSPLLGLAGVGVSARVDALSVTMLLLVTFLGGTVLHFSRQYLAGDARHGIFMRDLALTLAAITCVMLAANLYLLVFAWITMSLLLNRLLLFRGERRMARLAARKKFILARVGDTALLAASGLLIAQFGTADIGELATQLGSMATSGAVQQAPIAAAALLAVTAVLKSAQFPAHGWLVEVMETPTPVSALLHAGIVNAGGFLILRFSELFSALPAVGIAVAAVGATTAIIGTGVMLVQTNIKSSLAWSTVGQMGFMIFQCGMGVYAAAMVHLVGHSLYKAHAFLSSGDAVRRVTAENWQAGSTSGNRLAGTLMVLLATGLYLFLVANLYSNWQQQPVVPALGLVLMLAILLFNDAPQAGVARRTWLLFSSALVAASYLVLQQIAAFLYSPGFAASPAVGTAGIVLLALLLTALAGVVLLQGSAPHSGFLRKLRVHLSQGLYINVFINRWLGAYRTGRISSE